MAIVYDRPRIPRPMCYARRAQGADGGEKDMKPTKPVHAKLKKLVIDSLRQHCWNMGVSHYVGDILYMENDDDLGGNSELYADITVDTRYKKCVLRVYPAMIREWREQGDKFVEGVVAHEVAHILVQPLLNLATSVYKSEKEVEDAQETLTEMISRISLKVNK